MKARRPRALFTAAVWGIYKPLPGCSTSQGYGNYYQDSIAWLEAGTMDALAPMVYWPIEPGTCTDWSRLVDGFVSARFGRHIWAGMHALDDNMWSWDGVKSRIELSRTNGTQGTLIFASAYLEPDRWNLFLSPPQLVAREDVHIGYNPIYEYAALPDLDQVIEAIRVTME